MKRRIKLTYPKGTNTERLKHRLMEAGMEVEFHSESAREFRGLIEPKKMEGLKELPGTAGLSRLPANYTFLPAEKNERSTKRS